MNKALRHLFACFAMSCLILVLSGCPQPNHTESTPDIPETGPWSTDDLATMLTRVENLQSSQGESGSSVAKYLEWIRINFGEYVATGRGGKPSYRVLPSRLSYSSHYSEGSFDTTWSLSGLALIPIPAAGAAPLSAPIIAFQHGTQVNRLNAPSLFSPNVATTFFNAANPEKGGALQNYVECVVGAYMAASGYIVVMPDYPGFGSSTEQHPYVHQSLGASVRDAVTAVKALASTPEWSGRVAWNTKLYLLGYSEGGYATMVGARALQAEGQAVTAAAPGAGSYDLSGTMAARIASGTTEPNPYYVPYLIVGYHAIYGDSVFKYDLLFNGSYPTSLPPLFDGTHSTADMLAAMPASHIPLEVLTAQTVSDLSTSSSSLSMALQANDAYRGWLPNMKMLLLHCQTDDVVPVENTDIALADFISRGSDPSLITKGYVSPIDVGDPGAEVHPRAFPTAILEGFTFIENN